MQAFKPLVAGAAALLLGGCLSTFPADGFNKVSRFETPRGMHRLMSPADHNFRRGFLSDGEPVRRGVLSERFELRDGDCGGSDCDNPRARAEIQTDRDENPARIGQDIWYGWSFYNASIPSFRAESSLRLVFGQWTMGGKNKPIFRFIQLGKGEASFDGCDPLVCNTRDRSKGDLVVQLEDIAKAQGWDDTRNNGYVCRLFDLAERQGQWVDIVVNTNFSPGEDGYLRIWVDQRMVCNYTGPLVSPQSLASGRAPGHRRGIYSSWTSRWEKIHGDTPRPRLVAYYDEFRTGKQMSEVDVRHLENTQARPVD